MILHNTTYLAFHPNPSRPVYRALDGACDSHCHVFGPQARFSFAAERTYTPVDAPKETLMALHDHLGLAHGIIVQASCHGTDNRAMLDAIASSNGRYRGVAMVDADADISFLRELHRGGVRGLRFNFVKHLGADAARDAILRLAPLIAKLGWHVVIHCDMARFPEIVPLLRTLPLPVVIDHMARIDAKLGFDQPVFRLLCETLVADEKFWVKVCGADRISAQGPPYADSIPFAHMLVELAPDRVLWGTDWPHPNARAPMPDDGVLTDLIPKIAPQSAQQHKMLIDNPARLYWSC